VNNISIPGKYFRIIIYSDHFFPSIGGSENYALDLAQELTRQGHFVAVITAEGTSNQDNFPFKVYRIKRPLSLHNINFNFLEVSGIVKEFRPDVCHISYQTGGENLLIILLKFLRVPIILTYHADHVVPLGRMIDRIQALTTFRFVNKILVQTERDYNAFVRMRLKKERLILMRFNGIDTNKYICSKDSKNTSSQIRIVCIARLDNSHKYKGLEQLINMISHESSNSGINDFEFVIIGSGNMQNYYMDLSRSKGITNIHFLGHIDDQRLIEELCKSDFLILPSIDKAEGFGRVALEAISTGIPVVVSIYSGISEIIGKYNAGIIYDPLYENSLDRVREVYSNLQKYYGYIENSLTMLQSEGLTLEMSVKRTVSIYKEILRKKRVSRLRNSS